MEKFKNVGGSEVHFPDMPVEDIQNLIKSEHANTKILGLLIMVMRNQFFLYQEIIKLKNK